MAGELVRFRRVLQVRETEREISQSELAVKMREEESILERLDIIQSAKEIAMDEFCSGKPRVISPQELWFERQNLDIMEKKIDAGQQELENCRVEIEEKKNVLMEKHRNVRLMEGYVGRLRQLEDKKIIKAEQANLDDITAMRYMRGINGGMNS